MPIAATHFGDDAPSGENLEYEKVFTDLLLAAQPEAERQVGEEIIASQDPDPRIITERALAVLALSNDLRAAILYGYAQLRMVGFPGLAEATGYLRACLEDYWDSCHPQLDTDDDDDPTMRVNCLLGLVDPGMMLRALRTAPLTDSPAFGRISLRDIAIADGEITLPDGSEGQAGAQTISAAFQDTAPDTLAANLAAIRAIQSDVTAINAVFDNRIPAQGPNLSPILTLMKKAATVLSAHVATEDADTGAEDAPAAAPDVLAAPSAAAAAPPGTITSQADVEKALGRIIDYYARHEPSSPLPILLKRAQRLVGADFLTIIEDIAPLGLENVKLIGGMENPE